MKKTTLKIITDYLYQCNPDYSKQEIVDEITSIISWLTYYFRMFVGEEEYRGSPVAIFEDVENFDRFDDWFCKKFTMDGLLPLQKKDSYIFFTIVEPASVNTISHYTGVRVYNDRVMFFDSGVGMDNNDLIWDNMKAIEYTQKIAKKYGFHWVHYMPLVRCQREKKDIYCQTWSLMWNEKADANGSATNFPGTKLYELYRFIRQFIKNKRVEFDEFVPYQILMDDKMTQRTKMFWNGLFKILSSSHIILDLMYEELIMDTFSKKSLRRLEYKKFES